MLCEINCCTPPQEAVAIDRVFSFPTYQKAILIFLPPLHTLDTTCHWTATMELLTLFAGALGIAAALAASIDPIMTTVTLQAQPADPGDLGPNEILKYGDSPMKHAIPGKTLSRSPSCLTWCGAFACRVTLCASSTTTRIGRLTKVSWIATVDLLCQMTNSLI